MNVLLVFFGDDYHGGTTYSTFTIAKELVARGHEVHAFARVTSAGTLARDLESCGVRVHDGRAPILVHPLSPQSLPMRVVRFGLEQLRRFVAYPKSEREIESIIKSCSIDLVAIASGAIATGSQAATKAGIPYVWHVREFMQEDHNLDYYPWAPVYDRMNAARDLICVSRAIEDKFRKLCPDAHTDVVYNGIDATVFNPDGRVECPAGDPVRIMFSGGIKHSKGAFLALDALGQLPDGASFVFDVYGEEGGAAGENAKDYLAYARERGVEGSVHYHGTVSNIADEYRSHDLLIVASKAEAFGRVTAEAMLCGCAVVGSASGGTPELISDGRGYLFAPQDASSLADALKRAIEDTEGRERVCAEALSYAREHFSVKAYVDGIETAYQAAVS